MSKQPETREVLPPPTTVEFVIHAGGTLSDPVNIASGTMTGIVTPGNWTPAHMTFQVSIDGQKWLDLCDSQGRQVGLRTTAMPPEALVDISNYTMLKNMWVRVRSGTRNFEIPQAEDCTFTAVIVT